MARFSQVPPYAGLLGLLTEAQSLDALRYYEVMGDSESEKHFNAAPLIPAPGTFLFWLPQPSRGTAAYVSGLRPGTHSYMQVTS